jgi:hypothetical protein
MLAQRQLMFQIRDPFLRVRDLLLGFRKLPIAFSQFATKAVILPGQAFLGVPGVLPPRVPRHALDGTPIHSLCTDP